MITACHRNAELGRDAAGHVPRGAVAIGNFDGVHCGHAALLAELREQARQVNGPAVVVTFDPHPLKLLRPEQFLPVLTLTADRAQLLEEGGADQVVILQTTESLLQLTAAAFFEQVIRQATRSPCLTVVPESKLTPSTNGAGLRVAGG